MRAESFTKASLLAILVLFRSSWDRRWGRHDGFVMAFTSLSTLRPKRSIQSTLRPTELIYTFFQDKYNNDESPVHDLYSLGVRDRCHHSKYSFRQHRCNHCRRRVPLYAATGNCEDNIGDNISFKGKENESISEGNKQPLFVDATELRSLMQNDKLSLTENDQTNQTRSTSDGSATIHSLNTSVEDNKTVGGISDSVLYSITRVKQRYHNSNIENEGDNEAILKSIVRAGIQWNRNQMQNNTESNREPFLVGNFTSFPTMERVPGCIATVHIKTSLVPINKDLWISNQSGRIGDPKNCRVKLEGTADAMLSGGLLALLSDVISGGVDETRKGQESLSKIVDADFVSENISNIVTENNVSAEASGVVTAEDIVNINSEILTTAMGLERVLSRGRNDGMASMLRVVQTQIRTILELELPPDRNDRLLKKEVVEESSNIHEIGNINYSVIDEELEQLLNKAFFKPNNLSKTNESNNTPKRKPKVAMLLSGGVDSSVALHLLLRQNYNVTAFYLRIWLEDELSHLGTCPWEDDLEVCKAVCEHAERSTGNIVPLETVSLGKEYRERVVQYTIEEAERGRTPNPDIMCNSRVKFGCFLEYVEKSGLDFDYVASGHYARLEDDVTTPTSKSTLSPMATVAITRTKRLYRAPDPIKDQSYFLCALTQNQLSNVLFPLGNLLKSQVRTLATKFQLPNRDRPDSQGLCFLGKVRFDDFLSSYLGNRPGNVIDASTGEVVGRHNGLWYHTVGQRKGIGKVMDPLFTARGPWYVVAKDPKEDVVYVSNRYEEEEFERARSEFEVEDVKWIAGKAPEDTLLEKDGETDHVCLWNKARFDMKIRHGPKIVQGSLSLKEDGTTGNVHLDKKDGGLAPGQFVAFYEMNTGECLGAGVISEKHWANFLQNYEDLISTRTEKASIR